MAVEARRSRVEKEHPALSISRQCALLGVNRSSLYYKAKPAAPEADKPVMDAMDRIMTEFLRCTPLFGPKSPNLKLQSGPSFFFFLRRNQVCWKAVRKSEA